MGLGELPGLSVEPLPGDLLLMSWNPSEHLCCVHLCQVTRKAEGLLEQMGLFVRLSAVLGMWLMAAGEFGVGVCKQENPNPT